MKMKKKKIEFCNKSQFHEKISMQECFMENPNNIKN